ncbi:MAG: hypothetical protein LC663_06390 [Actinobacteria bacterium]|nr:hypothetical protein [Actinomycetota bacterium]
MVLLVVVGIGLCAAVLALIARLPANTGRSSLAIRGAVAVVIGVIVIVVVRRMLRALTEPPPPPPQTVDARGSEVVYVCPVCGTRVRLELAATAKAPKHCGEEMEPQLARQ